LRQKKFANSNVENCQEGEEPPGVRSSFLSRKKKYSAVLKNFFGEKKYFFKLSLQFFPLCELVQKFEADFRNF
jgi:hypothetical protein